MSNLAFIIEDDADLAEIFAEALRAARYKVEIIQDGRAALERLAVAAPNVVVLDLHLPRVSGLEILQYVRADARLAQSQVIVTTADARMADMVEGEADLVLEKPISFSQLRDLAARLNL